MRLLREFNALDYDLDSIKRSKEDHGGSIVLKGVLQKADTLNQNGRVYPGPILEREIANYQKFIVERRALGECDHPDSSVVELKNVSHLVTEAYMEDGIVYGAVEILGTPGGKILTALIEAGVKLGISSRGVGSTVKQGDHDVVQEDFQLICFDMVSEPSTPNAFMMSEGKEIDPRTLRRVFRKSDRIYRAAGEYLDGSND